jgi:hypothetical protein
MGHGYKLDNAGCTAAALGALYGFLAIPGSVVMPEAFEGQVFYRVFTAPLGRMSISFDWGAPIWLCPLWFGWFAWAFWAAVGVCVCRWKNDTARFVLAVMISFHYVVAVWTLVVFAARDGRWGSPKILGIPDDLMLLLAVFYFPAHILLWVLMFVQVRRFGFQFTLRSLMLYVTVIAVIVAWIAATPGLDRCGAIWD